MAEDVCVLDAKVAGADVDAGAVEVARTVVWMVEGAADVIVGAKLVGIVDVWVETIFKMVVDAGAVDVGGRAVVEVIELGAV